ncbi:MAG: rhodanese-like domain-containing protein [Deltaproteobacteria bacterium]|nr:rhodanese-like domain-containing protein [Candidatus Tharpella aukensis]
MKRFILAFMAIMIIAGLLSDKGYTYETIPAPDAYEMFLTDEKLIIVDVREKVSEYCYGHIPCSLNYPWRSGVFYEEFHNLPTDAPILLVCHSGGRSGNAAQVLDRNGYETVYSLSGGMSAWIYETITCDDIEDCDPTYPLYFPHIASGNDWESEISVINTSPDTPLSGTFKAYDTDGELLDDTQTLNLPARGRVELIVGETFSDPTQIRYIILKTNKPTTYGYTKFYDYPGLKYRAAIPATTNINQKDISVSHIALENGWWTGLALVNTTDEDRELTFTFNNRESQTLSLPAKAHKAINLADFLEGLSTQNLKSAIISDAEGVIGLEMFSNGMQLSGTLFKDGTSTTLYYPHIASDDDWWTGIAAFNPGPAAGELVIKPYAADGTSLSPAEPATPIEIAAKSNFIKAVSQLELPESTAWLKIEATVPINGFELFATTDNKMLAGYSSVGLDGLTGIFPKNSDHDSNWTGLAFANTTPEPITVTLKAYRDDGTLVESSSPITLNGYQKKSDIAIDFFNGDIDSATYIAYRASAPVVAFQLNGNGTMLDALPGRH